MKTVSWKVSMNWATAMIDSLMENGFEVYEIPGSLLDNYICFLGENNGYKIRRFKCRKYILIREVYQNPWSSGLEFEMTDDDSVWDVWYKRWEEYMDEEEREFA